VNDVLTQSFFVVNHSSFAINIVLNRSICENLSPYEQINEITDRNISGLPIFTYRPEKVRLQPGRYMHV
jgi:hypothetical protein